MARHLIQSATTGETRIVGDAALPFFPGYVIKDTLEDGQPPAVYYDGGESDLRYVNVSELSNPESAPSIALRAAFGSPLPFAAQRLLAAGAAQSVASVDRSVAAYETVAGFTESWADLTAWTTTAAQVSGGNLYASGGGSQGGNRSFALAAGTGRIRSSIQVVTGSAGSGLTLVGVSSAAAGAAPAGGSLLAIGVDQTGKPSWYGNNTLTALSGTALSPGRWEVTVTVDETNISMVLNGGIGVPEYQVTVARSAFGAINNVAAWNSDARALGSQHGIGPVAARAGIVTPVVRTGVEDVGPSAQWTPDSAGQNIHIALPKGYDSRTPVPLVLACHGNNEDELFPLGLANPVYVSLLGAGYAVASSYQHGNNWGSQASVDDLARLYRYVRDRYAIGPVLLLAQSMGGLSSLNAIAKGAIPGLAGFAGIYPVTNLATMYAAGTYAGTIRTAYGIASDGSDYASKTAGFDPMLNDKTAFQRLPMRFYASTADTQVARANNSDALAAKVADYAPEAVVVSATGDHGDPSHFQGADLVAFFNRCLAR